MSVGATKSLTINKRYVEDGANYEKPGATVYAPDTDRMKSSYTKYIFEDTAAFQQAMADGNNKITFTIAGKSGDVRTCVSGACPEGGFRNTVFLCKDVAAAASAGGSSSSEDDE